MSHNHSASASSDAAGKGKEKSRVASSGLAGPPAPPKPSLAHETHKLSNTDRNSHQSNLVKAIDIIDFGLGGSSSSFRLPYKRSQAQEEIEYWKKVEEERYERGVDGKMQLKAQPHLAPDGNFNVGHALAQFNVTLGHLDRTTMSGFDFSDAMLKQDEWQGTTPRITQSAFQSPITPFSSAAPRDDLEETVALNAQALLAQAQDPALVALTSANVNATFTHIIVHGNQLSPISHVAPSTSAVASVAQMVGASTSAAASSSSGVSQPTSPPSMTSILEMDQGLAGTTTTTITTTSPIAPFVGGIPPPPPPPNAHVNSAGPHAIAVPQQISNLGIKLLDVPFLWLRGQLSNGQVISQVPFRDISAAYGGGKKSKANKLPRVVQDWKDKNWTTVSHIKNIFEKFLVVATVTTDGLHVTVNESGAKVIAESILDDQSVLLARVIKPFLCLIGKMDDDAAKMAASMAYKALPKQKK